VRGRHAAGTLTNLRAVAVNTSAVGKSYAPMTYAVGREKIREYAYAVGETNPLHLEVEAARAAGYRDVVAPPMFAAVYSSPAIGPVLFDPEVGINFALMVHGGQEFKWGPLVIAGDEIETTVTVKDISERSGTGFYVFESVSTNQDSHTVCVGTWTNIVRGAS
jgi:acyl dehydratase